MLEVILENIIKILAALLLSAIAIGGKMITNKLDNKLELQNVHAAQQELNRMACQTVCQLEQTVVNELKKANADGKLTVENIKYLGEELVKLTLNKMCQPTIDLLNAAGVDITAAIHGAAEDYILLMKG